MNDLNNPNFIWHVESLRFTLFYPITDQPPVSNLWKEITNELPQNRMERPQERLLVEEGAWNDNWLSVSVRPERVDIVISPAPIMTPVLPTVGLLDDVMSKVPDILTKLSFDQVTRIAFGLVVQHPEKDLTSAYQSLAKLLPNIKIESGSREFLYQINIPVKSQCNPSIEINRLQRWSAIFMEFITIDNPNRVKLFATRLELDINTHPDNLLADLPSARNLMDELIKEALSIAEERGGD
jgi:hypothetical protein